MTQRGKDWCILQTSPGRTVAVAAQLTSDGLDVWTPTRTIRVPAPGQRRQLHMGQRRKMIEVQRPILPMIIFAREQHLAELAQRARLAGCPFSIFTFAGAAPMIAEKDVAGLREAEQQADIAIQAERDAVTREDARRARADMLRSERAKRKSLRQERKTFAPGAEVIVPDMPALAGAVGRIVQGNGTSALINFGGTLTMKVEAWRVVPVGVEQMQPAFGAAA